MPSEVQSQPVAVRGAETGLLISALLPEQIEIIKRQLTLKTKPWSGSKEPPRTIHCYREDGGYLWVPRNYARRRFESLNPVDQTVLGMSMEFDLSGARLDPEREQDKSVPATIAALQEDGDGIVLSPTGTGKTFIGLYVGAYFGVAIGWPVYASHMEDNVRDHIHLIGLTQDDIGIVKGPRCDLGKPVTIMYVQSLLSSRVYPPELYTQMGIMICDEVNRHGAPKWKATLEQFPAAKRLGMTADLKRRDGLGPVIPWLFGRTTYRAERITPQDADPPKVIVFRWCKTYNPMSYCQWEKVGGEWQPGDPHPSKYDKVLAQDAGRNLMLMKEVKQALKTGRQIICLSRFVDHLVECRNILLKLLDPMHPLERLARCEAPPALPSVRMLRAGMKESQRREVYASRVIFATFKMANDALNVPSLDTLYFLTPPGDPLQPAGRIRWKAEGYDRRPLLIGECYEQTPYSERRWKQRRKKERSLGMSIKQVDRYPKNYRSAV